MIVVQFVISQDKISYELFVGEYRIDKSLKETLEQLEDVQTEKLVEIQYHPQARFKVQAVTRCTTSMPGVSVCVYVDV